MGRWAMTRVCSLSRRSRRSYRYRYRRCSACAWRAQGRLVWRSAGRRDIAKPLSSDGLREGFSTALRWRIDRSATATTRPRPERPVCPGSDASMLRDGAGQARLRPTNSHRHPASPSPWPWTASAQVCPDTRAHPVRASRTPPSRWIQPQVVASNFERVVAGGDVEVVLDEGDQADHGLPDAD
jgi:hypothetical protein